MALAESRLQPEAGRATQAGVVPRWRRPFLLGVVLAVVTLLPLAIAALQTPTGFRFSGYLVIARDAYVYQAIWREGWQGFWLFHSPYTSETLPGVLLYPWYLWPGHLVGWAAGPWLYHALRLLAALALVSAVWVLVHELYRPRWLRLSTFALCSLGGGIGVLLPHGLRLGPLQTQATESLSPGSSVADLVSMAPHLPWAMALFCWVMIIALRARRGATRSELISGLATILGLQLIYPQLALLAVLVVGGWAALQRHRGPLWFAIGGALLQLPYLGYLLWTALTAPQALAVIRPSLEVGDPFGFLVLSHLVATALIGVAIWRRRLRGDLWLPTLWIAGMTAFMFLPGLSQSLGRTFMASSVPFGLCAAPGLLSLLRAIRQPAWRRRLLAGTLAFSSLYGLFSLVQPFWIAALRLDARAEYESAAEASLLGRLAPGTSSADVVLSTYLDGIVIPAQTNARAFAGHPEMTIEAAQKSVEATAFFSSWTVEEQQAFLRRTGVTYVLAPDPAAAGRLAANPDLRRVDEQDGWALLAVRR